MFSENLSATNEKEWSPSGLPDGIFSCPKSQCCFIFVGIGMENLGIFYGHLVLLSEFGVFLPPFGEIFATIR
jgi:hypothetical protein